MGTPKEVAKKLRRSKWWLRVSILVLLIGVALAMMFIAQRVFVVIMDVDVILLVDSSTSVYLDETQQLAEMKASKTFVRYLAEKSVTASSNRIGIWMFGSTAARRLYLTFPNLEIMDGVITFDDLGARIYTIAFQAVYEEFERSDVFRTERLPVVVLVTTGEPNPDLENSEDIRTLINKLRKYGTRIYIVGLGEFVSKQAWERAGIGEGEFFLLRDLMDTRELDKLAVDVAINLNAGLPQRTYFWFALGAMIVAGVALGFLWAVLPYRRERSAGIVIEYADKYRRQPLSREAAANFFEAVCDILPSPVSSVLKEIGFSLFPEWNPEVGNMEKTFLQAIDKAIKSSRPDDYEEAGKPLKGLYEKHSGEGLRLLVKAMELFFRHRISTLSQEYFPLQNMKAQSRLDTAGISDISPQETGPLLAVQERLERLARLDLEIVRQYEPMRQECAALLVDFEKGVISNRVENEQAGNMEQKIDVEAETLSFVKLREAVGIKLDGKELIQIAFNLHRITTKREISDRLWRKVLENTGDLVLEQVDELVQIYAKETLALLTDTTQEAKDRWQKLADHVLNLSVLWQEQRQ